VAHDIGQKLGKPAMLFEHLPKELAKDAIAAQDFFKHAKDELGEVHRFSHPRQVMAYLGLIPSNPRTAIRSSHSRRLRHETGRNGS
jgi:hypothetical protein